MQTAAVRIRGRLKASIVDTGEDLIKYKDQLQHGDFIRWVEEECYLGERTAQRCMCAAEWARDKSVTVTDKLTPATLYLLSAPSTPEPIQTEVLKQIEAGETVDPNIVKQKVSAAKKERDRAERRERDRLRRKETPEEQVQREELEKREEELGASKREAKRLAREKQQAAQREKEKSEAEQREQARLAPLIEFLTESVADLARLIQLLDVLSWGDHRALTSALRERLARYEAESQAEQADESAQPGRDGALEVAASPEPNELLSSATLADVARQF